jgi:peptidyl-prolyl cis-trans isomerase C
MVGFMKLKHSSVAVMLAVLLLPAAASADSTVVATVNGYEITASEVRLAADDILPQLGEVPANLRFPFVVEYLMERHLLAQAAVKEGIAESEEYRRRLAFYQAKALRDAYFASKLMPSVTEERVRQAYDEQAAKVEAEERARARHILVASEQEAKDIAARLAQGEEFEALAASTAWTGRGSLAAIWAISPLMKWCRNFPQQRSRSRSARCRSRCRPSSAGI